MAHPSTGRASKETSAPYLGRPRLRGSLTAAATVPGRAPSRAISTNGRCRMHGGASPGAPVGNANARKHGLYTADAIAERRELAALIRSMRGLSMDIQSYDVRRHPVLRGVAQRERPRGVR